MKKLKAIESATAVIENVHQVYRKSEADKVIADLEKSHKMEVEQFLIEIAELKAQKAQAEDDCAYWKTMAQKNAADNSAMAKQRAEAFKQLAELKEGAKNLILDNYLKDKEIRRHKYKRCLAMAKWCAVERDIYNLTPRFSKVDFYIKWHKKWHELAEKFKEAK